ncbi:MAG: hypothetical protein PVF85_06685 [Anaerolineales bacterium]|jgi:hypothetical protein
MTLYKKIYIILAALFLTFLVAGCTGQTSPASAVVNYLEAIVAKDVVAATNLSCLAWEEGAYAEASSFETVEVRLEGVSCEVIDSGEEYQRVTCDGEIVANYGGEDQDIALASRDFYVIEEGGEWRMCGYSAP